MEPVTKIDVIHELPKPGDIVIALCSMRSWYFDDERGFDGVVISPREMGIVIQQWSVGGKLRLRVLVGDQLLLFSCRKYLVRLNWAFGEALDASKFA